MRALSTEKKSIMVLGVIAGVLTAAACFDIFCIVHGIYKIAVNQEIISNDVPSLLYGVCLYWSWLIMPEILLLLFVIWTELDNNDDFAVPAEKKVDPMLFNPSLRKAILANCVVPLVVSGFVLPLRIGEVYSREMAQLLLGAAQMVVFFCFALEYKTTVKYYKRTFQ